MLMSSRKASWHPVGSHGGGGKLCGLEIGYNHAGPSGLAQGMAYS